MSERRPASDNEMYCKVFLNAEVSTESLVEILARRFSTHAEHATVSAKHLAITVNRNEDFNAAQLEAPGKNAFLHYRHFLDIVRRPGTSAQDYIAEVASLLKFFWKKGWRAVAACDFEKSLPNDGGIALL